MVGRRPKGALNAHPRLGRLQTPAPQARAPPRPPLHAWGRAPGRARRARLPRHGLVDTSRRPRAVPTKLCRGPAPRRPAPGRSEGPPQAPARARPAQSRPGAVGVAPCVPDVGPGPRRIPLPDVPLGDRAAADRAGGSSRPEPLRPPLKKGALYTPPVDADLVATCLLRGPVRQGVQPSLLRSFTGPLPRAGGEPSSGGRPPTPRSGSWTLVQGEFDTPGHTVRLPL